ncbi:cytidylate kinase [Rubricella aquisinus]|uniref:Cytidylate kinase n=1 Tax=Rubricella aquisinus TaxID=2028108 RepID=A0A840WNT1_9RHOB|nr:(d)CMP kinase [Rubricella aquisinus]MBB5516718.1 cytidylate kinase [Rubricella aquisinus]
MRFTVAIDGPAAAGKGTISRGVAARFGFAHLDTGLLYRATGRRALIAAGAADAVGEVEAIAAAKALTEADLARDDLRTAEAGAAASRVAAIPAVRAALLDWQRGFARREGGAVLDGRDIGTVICPDADVKLFVTASDAVRAQRRYEELHLAGHDVTYEDVAAQLAERDARDAARDAAPMIAAADALQLDTTSLTAAEALDCAIAHIEAKLSKT